MRTSSLFRKTAISTLLLAALAPTAALAHPGHQAGENLLAGALHPLTGLDHVLMIIAVSAWAVLLPTRGRIMVATSLALFVGLGALIPVQPGQMLEAAIALTVIGAGALLAVGKGWPAWATGLLAASFALIHGFAHGAEGPARNISYLAGLMLATFVLALATCLLAASVRSRRPWFRLAGVLSAGAGAAALLG